MAAGILQTFKKRSIIFSAALVLVLVVANASFLIYNNHVLKQATKVQNQSEAIKDLLNVLWNDVIRNMDMGLRGYALTGDEGLLSPFYDGVAIYETTPTKIQTLLIEQGYPDMQGFNNLIYSFDDYVQVVHTFVDLLRANKIEEFKEELKKDLGLALWLQFDKYSSQIRAYQDKLYNEATARHNRATRQLLIMQFLLGLIGIPTLTFMIIRIIHDEKARKKLFEELDTNNRKYLFDPGTEVELNDERQVINSSILNFKRAASFISQISAGNLKVDWEGLDESNKEFNKTNLAGELIQMREKMAQIKIQDAKRIWISEGLTNFAKVLRTYQHDLKLLGDHSISFIVKYLEAQQGTIYIVRGEDEKDTYLEMISCYAFNKKKYLEKKIELGQGLVGQAFLEKQTTMLTEVPQGYFEITSGLGEASPDCLLIVPMIYNEKVEAVVEIASFNIFEEHHIGWMEKSGEIMASIINSIKIAEKTHFLLDQFKVQTEQLKAQEEELRQNMEEMEATQEEMRRKEKELELRQTELNRLLEKNKK